MRRLLVLLVWLLPLLFLIILGERGLGVSPFLVALILFVLFLAAGALIGGGGGSRRQEESGDEQEKKGPSDERMLSLANELQPFLSVKGWKAFGGIVQFEGLLRTDPEDALKGINAAVDSSKLRVILTEGEQNQIRVTLVPVGEEEQVVKKPNWPLHGILLLLTIATTTWAGAMHQGVDLLQNPAKFGVALPYSIGLLLILGAHELGHYFAARRHRIQVTPPYFIPAPFALGTFGAFISMRGAVQDRRALFDVAVAGPLAGLVFAIPALLIGLQYSTVVTTTAPSGMFHGGVEIGSSFLMAILSKLALGPAAAEGHRLILHPLAFAGWLGLLVTALNLLPIGQLDGGHISHALFGSRRARSISVVGLVSLFLLAFFVWPGLMMWAFIVFFIAGTRDTPATNDLTPLDPSRQALGYFAFVLLALILVPVPHSLYGTFGIHCPYV
jgi:Zn-dependent protease